MTTFYLRRFSFTELCINGQVVPYERTINTCSISQKGGRYYLLVKLTYDMSLEIDILKSLTEYNYSKWDPDPDAVLIVDFRMRLTSIPSWLSSYSTALDGCAHFFHITMKVQASQSAYNGFISDIRSYLTTMQCNSLENAEAIILWNKRCTPQSPRTVKSIALRPPHFEKFSLQDLERLKDDTQWLSDSHVTLFLQHWFQDCAQQNLWGNLKIHLFDTTFWSLLSKEPERFVERFRTKNNMLEYDFAIMPMFEEKHWRLGIIERPGEFLQDKMVFHILDSLRNDFPGIREANQLQNIFLKYFEGQSVPFKKGRIATNIARVPCQLNSNDCGCFMVYFAKKFLLNPVATMTLIKVGSFSSAAAGRTAWGLKNHNLSFVRREIRTLLFNYINKGEASVEFD